MLTRFANEFRDGQIWSRSLFTARNRRWAGLVVERVGGKWMIASHDLEEGQPSLKGAEIVACDGIDAETLGRQRTGSFHANWDVEASLPGAAYTLLLDDQSGLIRLPDICEFRLPQGKTEVIKLQWRQISARELTDKITTSIRPPLSGFWRERVTGRLLDLT
ncbi:MAG: hypothetical protein ABI667_09650 [Sphingomicrobium sp.]